MRGLRRVIHEIMKKRPSKGVTAKLPQYDFKRSSSNKFGSRYAPTYREYTLRILPIRLPKPKLKPDAIEALG